MGGEKIQFWKIWGRLIDYLLITNIIYFAFIFLSYHIIIVIQQKKKILSYFLFKKGKKMHRKKIGSEINYHCRFLFTYVTNYYLLYIPSWPCIKSCFLYRTVLNFVSSITQFIT